MSQIDDLVAEKKYCECGTDLLVDGYSASYRAGENEEFEVDPESICCLGCAHARDFDRFRETGIVTAKLLMLANLQYFTPNASKAVNNKRLSVRDYCLPTDAEGQRTLEFFALKLDLATAEFQGRVWFDAKLQQFIKSQKHRGLSGTYIPTSWREYQDWKMDVRCFSCAGRFLITFEVMEGSATGTNVSFITEEDSTQHRMGWQSCHGKTDDILTLCEMATWGWGEVDRVRMGKKIDFSTKLSSDENVSII